MSGSLDQQVKPGHLLSLRNLYCGEDTAKPARGGRAAAAVQPSSSHTIARCALSPRGARSLPEVLSLFRRGALSLSEVRSLRPRLSPSEARSLLLSPRCSLSPPAPVLWLPYMLGNPANQSKGHLCMQWAGQSSYRSRAVHAPSTHPWANHSRLPVACFF